MKIGYRDDVPAYARIPFINYGYRINFTKPILCLKSIFMLHNETLNIWTHLLPSIVFLLSCAYDSYSIFLHEYQQSSLMAFVIYPISACITMLCSCYFHTFHCISHKYHTFSHNVDFVGISGLIMGSSWSCAYYSFYYDYDGWTTYSYVLAILTVLALAIPFIPGLHSDEMRIFRAILFVSFATFPAFLSIHLSVVQGIDTDLFKILYSRVFLSYFMYSCGLFFYLTRIPERFSVGRFDIYFHSHQFWHTFVALAAYKLYQGLSEYSLLLAS